MVHDPLLQYEQIEHLPIRRKNKNSKVFRFVKMIVIYLVMTGTIFASFMGALNFSAYSAIVTHWINPNRMMTIQDDMEQALISSSVEIHAADLSSQNSLQAITDQVAITDPETVYARSYQSDRLLSGMSRSLPATFNVNPYENRIIIPKL